MNRWLTGLWLALFVWTQHVPAAALQPPVEPSHPAVCCCKDCSGDCCCVQQPEPDRLPPVPALPSTQSSLPDGLMPGPVGDSPLLPLALAAPPSFLQLLAAHFGELRLFARNCAWLI